MTFEELQKFIDEQDAFFRSLKNGSHGTERERILARTVKISEELGELCDEVLAATGDQRQDKIEGRNPEDLGDEFADVLLTTLLLAKSMNIDIPAALERKIKKIKRNIILSGSRKCPIAIRCFLCYHECSSFSKTAVVAYCEEGNMAMSKLTDEQVEELHLRNINRLWDRYCGRVGREGLELLYRFTASSVCASPSIPNFVPIFVEKEVDETIKKNFK